MYVGIGRVQEATSPSVAKKIVNNVSKSIKIRRSRLSKLIDNAKKSGKDSGSSYSKKLSARWRARDSSELGYPLTDAPDKVFSGKIARKLRKSRKKYNIKKSSQPDVGTDPGYIRHRARQVYGAGLGR